jgi:hypothetical protein
MGMTDDTRLLRDITRRHFFKEVGFGVGTVALASLMNERLLAFTPEADQAVAAAAAHDRGRTSRRKQSR